MTQSVRQCHQKHCSIVCALIWALICVIWKCWQKGLYICSYIVRKISKSSGYCIYHCATLYAPVSRYFGLGQTFNVHCPTFRFLLVYSTDQLHLVSSWAWLTLKWPLLPSNLHVPSKRSIMEHRTLADYAIHISICLE